MAQRFNITINAKTSAGGLVTSATHFVSTNGLGLALEGDTIDCPACHSKGRIKCDGARIPSTFNGKQSALSDDLCICNCDPPPKLIAVQDQMYQFVSDDMSGSWTTMSRFLASTAPTGTHDLAFEVKDETGQPLSAYPYVIELPDGTCLEGITDRDGFTRKVVAKSPELAKLTVYAPDPFPVDAHWDR